METSDPLDPSGESKPKAHAPIKWHHWLHAAGVVVAGVVLGLLAWWTFVMLAPKALPQQTINAPAKSTEKPTFKTETVASGYDHIWEIAFLPTNEMLFTERSGTLFIMQNGKTRQLANIADIVSQGEAGLLGLAVDTSFTDNRYIYMCFDSNMPGVSKPDVRVARWKVSADLTKVEDRVDIVTNMPFSNGRHSGCRVKMGPDGYVWVGTGDAAFGGFSTDPKGLGGKILRVDRDGKAAPGNLGGNFDARIYSYGHRNVQGIAFFSQAQDGVLGISTEHGSDIDDEINLLKPGNFGWDPAAGDYVEKGVPMTDKTRFPDAVDAVWASGSPTVALSGSTFLFGSQWKAWEGRLAVALLKDQRIRVFTVNSDNKIADSFDDLFVSQFGRLRTVVEGPDGNLYASTDNGKTDQIIRITPQ